MAQLTERVAKAGSFVGLFVFLLTLGITRQILLVRLYYTKYFMVEDPGYDDAASPPSATSSLVSPTLGAVHFLTYLQWGSICLALMIVRGKVRQYYAIPERTCHGCEVSRAVPHVEGLVLGWKSVGRVHIG